jgi:putative NADPH-quinone reductase
MMKELINLKIAATLWYLVLIIISITGFDAIGQKDILVVLAHPNLEQSEVNSHYLSKLKSIKEVSINNLYKKYPDYNIDVAKEQELLISHDIIIFQFPLYWFSSPALLRKWQDDVITSAFSIGQNNKLKGKELMIVTSVGGTKSDYRHGDLLNITIDEVLSPFEAFAHLTEMKYLSPFITYGVPNPKLLNIKMSTVEMNKRHQQIELRGDELVNLIQNLLVNRN